ncbi:MAG: hypothetical protein AB2421_08260 [Thermotaleaceae bacterium]
MSEDEETKRINELLEKHLSDTKTRVEGTKRKIANNLLKNHPSFSIKDIADVTQLDEYVIRDLEKKLDNNNIHSIYTRNTP